MISYESVDILLFKDLAHGNERKQQNCRSQNFLNITKTLMNQGNNELYTGSERRKSGETNTDRVKFQVLNVLGTLADVTDRKLVIIRI